MALRLADRWIWDWWLADTGSEFHAFFLQAPRSLGHPDRRHRHATVGHAVSADLRAWRLLPDALGPGPAGAWDDLATWTGSTVHHDGTWHLLYTGVSSRDGGLVQRIGLATSVDLVHWEKDPANPVLEPYGRWYEVGAAEAGPETAWRDPWIIAEPDGSSFHALITARTRSGPLDERGVIGAARSPDLREWELLPPLSKGGEFGHLEVPQTEVVDGTAVLLFSCPGADVAARRRRRWPGVGNVSYIATGESLLGPWDIPGARHLPVPDLYSARIVRDRAGEWQVIGFYDGSDRGGFVGELSDPIRLMSLGLW